MQIHDRTLIRKNCKDIWNAWMLSGAVFDVEDIPICPSTATELPKRMISWRKAREIDKRERAKDNPGYRVDAFVHFYCDDQYFDGNRTGVWTASEEAVSLLKHFAGTITPDFSTYLDLADPLRRFNTYRMRAFGYYAASCGVPVINNLRWGFPETWRYEFSGIPKGSFISVGTVGSGLKLLEYRRLFEEGFLHAIDSIEPSGVVILGTKPRREVLKYCCGKTEIRYFDSPTNEAFRRVC